MTYTTYKAKVSGVIWQGCRASTFYTFDHQPTTDEVLQRSRDFQTVTKIQVVKTVSVSQHVSCAAVIR